MFRSLLSLAKSCVVIQGIFHGYGILNDFFNAKSMPFLPRIVMEVAWYALLLHWWSMSSQWRKRLAIINSLFLRETMNLALYFSVLSSTACWSCISSWKMYFLMFSSTTCWSIPSFCYSWSIYNKLGLRTLAEKSSAHHESSGWWHQMKHLPSH